SDYSAAPAVSPAESSTYQSVGALRTRIGTSAPKRSNRIKSLAPIPAPTVTRPLPPVRLTHRYNYLRSRSTSSLQGPDNMAISTMSREQSALPTSALIRYGGPVF